MSDTTHKPILGKAFVRKQLADDLYTVWLALWEIIKNGWDAADRKRRVVENFFSKVTIFFIENHVYNKSGRSLVIMDNGTGITPYDFEQFKKVGSDEMSPVTRGVTDNKRIGRYAAFALLEDTCSEYIILTRTDPSGPISFIIVHEDGTLVEKTPISPDNILMHGIKPESSFTMIILPKPKKELLDAKSFKETIELVRKQLPARKASNGLTLEINKEIIAPNELPKKLIIKSKQYPGIEGYFELDQSDSPQGFIVHDAVTNCPVAKAKDLGLSLPAPLFRPELKGCLFIPDLTNHQDTARTSISPKFLKSPQWGKIYLALYYEFRPELENLLGDTGKLNKDNVLENSVKNFIETMYEAHGGRPDLSDAPDIDNPLFPGNLNPNGQVSGRGVARPKIGGTGGHPHGSGGKKDPGITLPPIEDDKNRRKPRHIPFKYKDKYYYIGYSRMIENEFAYMSGSIIYFNGENPLIKDKLLTGQSAILHLAFAVIGEIERSLKKQNQMTQNFIPNLNAEIIAFMRQLQKHRKK